MKPQPLRQSQFQSTPLMRGATRHGRHAGRFPNISIHAPHARGDLHSGRLPVAHLISIHAPYARGDMTVRNFRCTGHYFNPRPSCEGRLKLWNAAGIVTVFQSTPLMRGATQSIQSLDLLCYYFNPRSSCEGRLSVWCSTPPRPAFQSTPLMRGATLVGVLLQLLLVISIHAPHARGDDIATPTLIASSRISIHAPHARGDRCFGGPVLEAVISIHAPHARGDCRVVCRRDQLVIISIHAPHARGDHK